MSDEYARSLTAKSAKDVLVEALGGTHDVIARVYPL